VRVLHAVGSGSVAEATEWSQMTTRVSRGGALVAAGANSVVMPHQANLISTCSSYAARRQAFQVTLLGPVSVVVPVCCRQSDTALAQGQQTGPARSRRSSPPNLFDVQPPSSGRDASTCCHASRRVLSCEFPMALTTRDCVARGICAGCAVWAEDAMVRPVDHCVADGRRAWWATLTPVPATAR
jgi:hypothetical protein